MKKFMMRLSPFDVNIRTHLRESSRWPIDILGQWPLLNRALLQMMYDLYHPVMDNIMETSLYSAAQCHILTKLKLKASDLF